MTNNIIRVLFKRNVINHFFTILFFLGGITASDKYQKYGHRYSMLVTFIVVMQLLGCFVSFLNNIQVQNRINILLLVQLYVYTFSLHLIVKVFKNKLWKFKLIWDEKHWKDEEFLSLTVDSFRNIILIFILTNVSIYFITLIIPLFIPLFTNINFQDKYLYIFPVWFHCFNIQRNNLFFKFLCFNVDNYRKYLIVNIMEFIMFFIELLPFFTTFLFYAMTQIYFSARVKIIIKQIENSFLGDEINKNDESTMYDDLIEIIKIHQRLHK